jgi:heterogeneous nuclear ribonucleoprotein U-like protein 1
MIGLPGAGKTHWATEFSRRFPEKKFNILGTNTLLDRMKVNGLPRKRNYHGRWDVLIGTCTQCFDEMLQLAAKRRRNYIIDQTNVFGTARLRKMQNFEGFFCKVIVVLPNDQEWKRRVALREAVEGKDVPDEAILEMKGTEHLNSFLSLLS